MYYLLNFQKNIYNKHLTKKVISNLKLGKCNNFYKPLIKGNIKYTKFNQFLNYCIHNKNEIKGSHIIRMKAKGTT